MAISPIYIVSKSRPDNCLTSKALDLLNVAHRVIVEPEQFDDYAKTLGPDRLIALPETYHDMYDHFDDLGRTQSSGPGPARNFAKDLSISAGASAHWVMDDNLHDFHRLHRNQKIPVRSDVIFRASEHFFRRYKNVPLAGLNYYSFCKTTDKVPPFVANTRIYSCLWIHNDIGLDWRGRYNEDTDLSLRVLKRGDCTIQMNAFLCGKVTTQRMKGGNTDEFYDKEGTKPKSQMLADMHPDVAKVVWKFNRWHHKVDYKPYRENLLVMTGEAIPEKNPFPMKLGVVPYKRKDETRELYERSREFKITSKA